MQKMGFLYALFLTTSIIGMKSDVIKLITNYNTGLKISKNTAKKIPLIKHMLQRDPI